MLADSGAQDRDLPGRGSGGEDRSRCAASFPSSRTSSSSRASAEGAIPLASVRERAGRGRWGCRRGSRRGGVAAGCRDARLHLGHHRPAEGLHAHARELHGRHRDVQGAARARRRAAGHLHVPAARARARADRPDGGAGRRRHPRLLVGRLHEDPAGGSGLRAHPLRCGPAHLREAARGRDARRWRAAAGMCGCCSPGRWRSGAGPGAAERAGRNPGPLSRARLRLADRLALARVRRLFGSRLSMALVGAAPIDREILEFFDACGVSVLEGYGMTESCAAATLNPRARAPLRDRRASPAGGGAEVRRGRRGPDARPAGVRRLSPRPAAPRLPCSRTAGCAPATSGSCPLTAI